MLIISYDFIPVTILNVTIIPQVKPVRDSILEALQLWEKIFWNADEGPDDLKSSSQGKRSLLKVLMFFPDEPFAFLSMSAENENQVLEISDKIDMDPGDSFSKAKGVTVMDKAVLILKKKVPALTDKELNPDFFQKHETWGSGDLPIEVIVPRGYHSSSNSDNKEHSSLSRSYRSRQRNEDQSWSLRAFDDEYFEDEERELTTSNTAKSNSHSGISVTIQRQLLQLERQQTQLMNTLQVL